jgi:DNA polymerase-1
MELAGIGMRVVLVNDQASWTELFSELSVARTISFDTETTCLDPLASHFDIVGMSFAVDDVTGYYLPIKHTAPSEPAKHRKRPKNIEPEEWRGKRNQTAGQGLLFYPNGQAAELPTQLPAGWVVERLKPLLETRNVMGHGLKFDYQGMKIKYGVQLNITYDTMSAAHLLDERASMKLKDLCEKYLGYKAMRFQEAVGGEGKVKDRKAPSNFELVPLDRATIYAAPDAVNPIRLRNYFRPQLAVSPEFMSLLAMEVRNIPITAEMELAGTLLDTNHLAAMHIDLLRVCDQKREQLRQLVGMPQLNPASQPQMTELIYGDSGMALKFPGKRRDKDSKKGLLARENVEKLTTNVRSEDLKTWRKNSGSKTHKFTRQQILDFLDLYQDLTKLQKLDSTYTHSLIDAISDDGRLHTLYHQHGTKSGRYASSSPNFQNAPRNTDPDELTYHYDIRKAFQAGYQGQTEPWVYVLADYSAMEMRICAALSGCQAMRGIILGHTRDKKGNLIDLHLYTACVAFQMDYDEAAIILKDKAHPRYPEIKEKRQQAKAVNFGIIYGITEHGLAANLNKPVALTLAIKNGFLQAYPGVGTWMSRTKDYLRQNLYTRTYAGRRRRISWQEKNETWAFDKAYRACLNHQVQGTGADIVKKAMWRVRNRFAAMNSRALVVGQIHDEIVVHSPESEYKLVAKAMVEEMREDLEGIPIVAEAEVKRTWSKLEEPLWKYSADGA